MHGQGQGSIQRNTRFDFDFNHVFNSQKKSKQRRRSISTNTNNKVLMNKRKKTCLKKMVNKKSRISTGSTINDDVSMQMTKTSTTTTCSSKKYNNPLNYCICPDNSHRVVIGNLQRFCAIENKFQEQETLFTCTKCYCSTKTILKLQRGGTIEYFHNILQEPNRKRISKYMDDCHLFRQYKINGFKEPRIHVLLSSNANHPQSRQPQQPQQNEIKECENDKNDENKINKKDNPPGPGYVYHHVKMKALPLNQAPVIESFASEMAKKLHIPNQEWNIGVDVILYRNGNDRIGWHADDTQGEDIILTVVVETNVIRTIKIRPKRSRNGRSSSSSGRRKDEGYQDGDELIELIVKQGSAYKMDGTFSI